MTFQAFRHPKKQQLEFLKGDAATMGLTLDPLGFSIGLQVAP